MNNQLEDFAEELLLSGKDRMPYRFDRRQRGKLYRGGLLTYPDGTFSLSESAIEEAIKSWRLAAKDAYGSPERRSELGRLVDEGTAWLARYRDPAAQRVRFADLSYQQYCVLWKLVTRASWEVFDMKSTSKREMALWDGLARRGYLTREERGTAVRFDPTSQATALVTRVGNPIRPT